MPRRTQGMKSMATPRTMAATTAIPRPRIVSWKVTQRAFQRLSRSSHEDCPMSIGAGRTDGDTFCQRT